MGAAYSYHPYLRRNGCVGGRSSLGEQDSGGTSAQLQRMGGGGEGEEGWPHLQAGPEKELQSPV